MSSATLMMTCVIVAAVVLRKSQKEVQKSSPSRGFAPRAGMLAAAWPCGCAYLLVDQSCPSDVAQTQSYSFTGPPPR